MPRLRPKLTREKRASLDGLRQHQEQFLQKKFPEGKPVCLRGVSQDREKPTYYRLFNEPNGLLVTVLWVQGLKVLVEDEHGQRRLFEAGDFVGCPQGDF